MLLNREEFQAISLHLKQFSTGLPHPHADRPVIPLGRAAKSWRKLSIRMEIVGPFLMLLLSWPRSGVAGSGDILLLVNWWTGEIAIVGTLFIIILQYATDVHYQRENKCWVECMLDSSSSRLISFSSQTIMQIHLRSHSSQISRKQATPLLTPSNVSHTWTYLG